MRIHLWCQKDPRGQGIDERLEGDDVADSWRGPVRWQHNTAVHHAYCDNDHSVNQDRERWYLPDVFVK